VDGDGGIYEDKREEAANDGDEDNMEDDVTGGEVAIGASDAENTNISSRWQRYSCAKMTVLFEEEDPGIIGGWFVFVVITDGNVKFDTVGDEENCGKEENDTDFLGTTGGLQPFSLSSSKDFNPWGDVRLGDKGGGYSVPAISCIDIVFLDIPVCMAISLMSNARSKRWDSRSADSSSLENAFKDGTNFIKATSTGAAYFPAPKIRHIIPASSWLPGGEDDDWVVDIGDDDSPAAKVTWYNDICQQGKALFIIIIFFVVVESCFNKFACQIETTIINPGV
jgi:hypothetical protein